MQVKLLCFSHCNANINIVPSLESYSFSPVAKMLSSICGQFDGIHCVSLVPLSELGFFDTENLV